MKSFDGPEETPVSGSSHDVRFVYSDFFFFPFPYTKGLLGSVVFLQLAIVPSVS